MKLKKNWSIRSKSIRSIFKNKNFFICLQTLIGDRVFFREGKGEVFLTIFVFMDSSDFNGTIKRTCINSECIPGRSKTVRFVVMKN